MPLPDLNPLVPLLKRIQALAVDLARGAEYPESEEDEELFPFNRACVLLPSVARDIVFISKLYSLHERMEETALLKAFLERPDIRTFEARYFRREASEIIQDYRSNLKDVLGDYSHIPSIVAYCSRVVTDIEDALRRRQALDEMIRGRRPTRSPAAPITREIPPHIHFEEEREPDDLHPSEIGPNFPGEELQGNQMVIEIVPRTRPPFQAPTSSFEDISGRRNAVASSRGITHPTLPRTATNAQTFESRDGRRTSFQEILFDMFIFEDV